MSTKVSLVMGKNGRFRRSRPICDADGGPFSTEWIDTAADLFRDVQTTKTQDVLLHGDLHHENILFDEKIGWIAIDSKGLVGDPCLEVGRFLHCGLPDAISLDEKRRLLNQRVEVFSQELDQSEERIRACGTIDIVSSPKTKTWWNNSSHWSQPPTSRDSLRKRSLPAFSP